MTDKKITELPEVTALTDDDVLVVVDGASVTKKITVGNAKTSIVADHLADTTDAHDASAVSVADAGGYYTGTNVETVLAEIGPVISGGGALRAPLAGVTALSDMQSGHGWTAGGAGTFTLDDTTDYAVGSQCIKVVTAGNGSGSCYIRKTGLTLNLATHDLLVWVKIDAAIESLSTINLTIASGTFTNIRTLTAYDATTGAAGVRQLRSDEWFPLRISAMQSAAGGGTLDLATVTELQFAVIDKNTAVSVTVKFGGVYKVPKRSAFPNGVVSVSFDDCYLSDYATARPIMARRGFAGTVYAIASRANGTDGPTAAQYREMQNVYGWDIQCHGLTSLTSLTATEAEADVIANKNWLASNGFGAGEHYAYPQGEHAAAYDDIIARHFTTARLAVPGTFETTMPGVPHRLRAQLVLASVTTGAVQTLVDNAYARPAWLHLVFHRLLASGATGADYNIAGFTTIIDYLATKGIPVLPVADVWRTLTSTT